MHLILLGACVFFAYLWVKEKNKNDGTTSSGTIRRYGEHSGSQRTYEPSQRITGPESRVYSDQVYGSRQSPYEYTSQYSDVVSDGRVVGPVSLRYTTRGQGRVYYKDMGGVASSTVSEGSIIGRRSEGSVISGRTRLSAEQFQFKGSTAEEVARELDAADGVIDNKYYGKPIVITKAQAGASPAVEEAKYREVVPATSTDAPTSVYQSSRPGPIETRAVRPAETTAYTAAATSSPIETRAVRPAQAAAYTSAVQRTTMAAGQVTAEGSQVLTTIPATTARAANTIPASSYATNTIPASSYATNTISASSYATNTTPVTTYTTNTTPAANYATTSSQSAGGSRVVSTVPAASTYTSTATTTSSSSLGPVTQRKTLDGSITGGTGRTIPAQKYI